MASCCKLTFPYSAAATHIMCKMLLDKSLLRATYYSKRQCGPPLKTQFVQFCLHHMHDLLLVSCQAIFDEWYVFLWHTCRLCIFVCERIYISSTFSTLSYCFFSNTICLIVLEVGIQLEPTTTTYSSHPFLANHHNAPMLSPGLFM